MRVVHDAQVAEWVLNTQDTAGCDLGQPFCSEPPRPSQSADHRIDRRTAHGGGCWGRAQQVDGLLVLSAFDRKGIEIAWVIGVSGGELDGSFGPRSGFADIHRMSAR